MRIDKKNIDQTIINSIKNDCFVKGMPNEYGPPETLRAYAETSNAIYLPFAYAKERFGKSPNKEYTFPITNYSFKTKQFPFRTDGGRDQEQVFNQAAEYIKKYRSVLLSLFCGYGKTYTGIRLAQATGMKTAILVHRSILTDQWEESIEKFTNAKVQRVDTAGILDPEADFYIFNIGYVHKKWNKIHQSWVLEKLGRYKDIGTLIVDEAHVACASEMSKALLHFNPRVMIALTATPEREDGLDKALELYFGKYSRTRIIRTSKNPFIVYRLPTGIVPEYTTNKMGKKDWGSVISYLVDCNERNSLIIELVQQFTDDNILVLTKLKRHCLELAYRLNDLGITNTIMTGTDKVYDKTARVLLSTYSKLGVGFDDSRLSILIVACSVKNVEQYAGRLRDAPGKNRIVIDLVDDDSNCKEHWRKRRNWYISRFGMIKNYFKDFPNTKIEKQSINEIRMNAKGRRLSRKFKK